MKKNLTNLPMNTLLQTARRAGQNAAAKAVAAGRQVAGWKDGRLVEYGLGAAPAKESLALTRHFKQIVVERVEHDPAFAKAEP